jgi:hypothetical protein
LCNREPPARGASTKKARILENDQAFVATPEAAASGAPHGAIHPTLNALWGNAKLRNETEFLK